MKYRHANAGTGVESGFYPLSSVAEDSFCPIPALTSRHHCFKVGGMSLIRGLFWLVLFIFFTFSFVVLFEYGTHDFANGFKQEAERVKKFCVDMASKPKASPSPGAKKK
jgi:hypothetical protein